MKINRAAKIAEVHFYALAHQGATTLIGEPQFDEKEGSHTSHIVVHLSMTQLWALQREMRGVEYIDEVAEDE